MSTLDDWAAALRAELGVAPQEDATRTVLDLARVVAHAVDRPAAPLTSFYLGMAVGCGQPLAPAAARIEDLAASWPAKDDEQRKP